MATSTETPIQADASLREAVIAELNWDPKINSPEDIAVVVRDAVVTLSGFVHSYWEKDAADKAVKRVYGVRGVANDIEVKLTWNRTDPEIARDAAIELQNHISIPADRIQVTVRSGWIALDGNVDWQYQKTLAESAVKKLKGVLGVTNNIEVRPEIAAEDLKSRIIQALRRSAGLDGRRITVETDGHTVILQGKVRSWWERQEAERAAWSAPGIRILKNELTVGP